MPIVQDETMSSRQKDTKIDEIEVAKRVSNLHDFMLE